jgi:aminopeptidase-like protein
LGFIKIESLADSFISAWMIFQVLEGNKKYKNTNPKCEPQLGKRKLYDAVGGQSKRVIDPLAMLWVLNMSDGLHSLLDIAIIAELPFSSIRLAADSLLEKKLLSEF